MAEVRIKSTHPASQGDFVDIEEENFDPAIHELYVPPGAEVVIPENWQTLHWKQRVALARNLVGGDEEITSDKATEIIAAEVAKRAAPAA
jgi:hypothetical protein